jgi:hypothetical protein
MESRFIIAAVVLVALVGGAWMYLSTSGTSVTGPSQQEFTLKIEDRKLVEGPSTLTVRQGDSVVIKITSDEDEEFHLHGYDRSVDLVPGEEVALSFVADASGHFPYELEHNKVEIGALDVLP